MRSASLYPPLKQTNSISESMMNPNIQRIQSANHKSNLKPFNNNKLRSFDVPDTKDSDKVEKAVRKRDLKKEEKKNDGLTEPDGCGNCDNPELILINGKMVCKKCGFID